MCFRALRSPFKDVLTSKVAVGRLRSFDTREKKARIDWAPVISIVIILGPMSVKQSSPESFDATLERAGVTVLELIMTSGVEFKTDEL